MSKKLKFASVQEKLDGASRSSIYRWVAQGILPPFQKIGGLNYMDESELNSMLSTLPTSTDE